MPGDANDELLREAGDPTTPGERLVQIVRGEVWANRPAGVEGWTLIEQTSCAALGNPSLPLAVLGRSLLETRGRSALAAWHNPSVMLLLLSEPRPEYRLAAHRLLTLETRQARMVFRSRLAETLAGLVHLWALVPRAMASGRLTGASLQCHALARHLAGLFGLPWPER